tara:strand:- start:484 stop:594 length:111 start_codon:yes stop_codon:yes gene_type:complete
MEEIEIKYHFKHNNIKNNNTSAKETKRHTEDRGTYY